LNRVKVLYQKGDYMKKLSTGLSFIWLFLSSCAGMAGISEKSCMVDFKGQITVVTEPVYLKFTSVKSILTISGMFPGDGFFYGGSCKNQITNEGWSWDYTTEFHSFTDGMNWKVETDKYGSIMNRTELKGNSALLPKNVTFTEHASRVEALTKYKIPENGISNNDILFISSTTMLLEDIGSTQEYKAVLKGWGEYKGKRVLVGSISGKSTVIIKSSNINYDISGYCLVDPETGHLIKAETCSRSGDFIRNAFKIEAVSKYD